MPTTDSNGIIRYLDTDGAPTPPVLNLGMQSVSDAISSVKRSPIKTVANATALLAYSSSETVAGRPPSTTAPLFAYQADTKETWINSGSGWLLQAPSRMSYSTAGTQDTGIDVPTSNITDVDGKVIRKTGRRTFFTTTAFGNEYAPIVTFPTAFPTGILYVSITQIHVQSAGTLAFAGAYATDSVSAANFRMLYVGGTAPTRRAFLFEAVGY